MTQPAIPPKNTKHFLAALFFVFSLCLGSAGIQWGLPTNHRIGLLFADKALFSDKIDRMINTRKRDIYQDNILKNKYADRKRTPFSREDAILHGQRSFLLSTFSGDEGETLVGISHFSPAKFDFDPRFYIYGGGFVYSAAAFLAGASIFQFTHLVPDIGYYIKNPSEMGNFFIVIREMTVLFTSLGILLFFLLTYQLFDPKTAVLATLFLLTCPLTTINMHTAEPHGFVLPFLVLSFWWSLKGLQQHSSISFYLAGASSGLAIGTQLTSLYIVTPFAVAVLWLYLQNKISLSASIKIAVVFGAISLLAFFAANPYVLINFSDFIKGFEFEKEWFKTYTFLMHQQISISLFLLFLISLFYAMVQWIKTFKKGSISGSSQFEFILLGIPTVMVGLGFHFYLKTTEINYHYGVLIFPAVFSAMLLTDLFKRFKIIPLVQFLIVFLLLAIPLFETAYYTINYLNEIPVRNPSEKAGQWINTHIPQGSIIAIKFPPTIWDTVPFQFDRFHLIDTQEVDFKVPAQTPDFIVYCHHHYPNEVKLSPYLTPHFKQVAAFTPLSILGYHIPRYPSFGLTHVARQILIFKKAD